jgi:hypothetical protein
MGKYGHCSLSQKKEERGNLNPIQTGPLGRYFCPACWIFSANPRFELKNPNNNFILYAIKFFKNKNQAKLNVIRKTPSQKRSRNIFPNLIFDKFLFNFIQNWLEKSNHGANRVKDFFSYQEGNYRILPIRLIFFSLNFQNYLCNS